MDRSEREARDRRIIELYQSGLTMREVGEAVGLSGVGVRHVLKRDGVPRRPPGTMRPSRIEIVGAIARVEMTNGREFATVDATDAALVSTHRWWLEPHGYVGTDVPRGGGQRPRRLRMHRLIMGDGPGDVDHINGDKLDNRRSNLRLVSRSDNMSNLSGPKSRKRKLPRNVYPVRGSERVRAQVRYNNKVHHLGTYDTPEEAEQAAIDWRAARGIYSHGDKKEPTT